MIYNITVKCITGEIEKIFRQIHSHSGRTDYIPISARRS